MSKISSMFVVFMVSATMTVMAGLLCACCVKAMVLYLVK